MHRNLNIKINFEVKLILRHLNTLLFFVTFRSKLKFIPMRLMSIVVKTDKLCASIPKYLNTFQETIANKSALYQLSYSLIYMKEGDNLIKFLFL